MNAHPVRSAEYLSKKPRSRNCAGQGIAELCAGLIIGIPLVLAGIDLGFVALGATLNDNVCRDAARAAAAGPPADVTRNFRNITKGQSPYQRAVSVIRTHSPTNLPMKVEETPQLTESIRDYPPSDMGGAIDGDVSVKTTIMVIPPFVLRMYCPEGMALTSKHSVPYTYVVLPPKKVK